MLIKLHWLLQRKGVISYAEYIKWLNKLKKKNSTLGVQKKAISHEEERL